MQIQNLQKCEKCSMDGNFKLILNNTEHYFCEHHRTKDSVKISSFMNENKYKKLTPLYSVFIGIVIVSLFRQVPNFNFMSWMMDFMGVFFVTFGLFKLYDLKGFVEGFKTYDIIAKRFTLFGYAFPFIEIILGVMYLAGFMFFVQNLFALIISLFGIYSSFVAIRNEEEIKCVCLGTVFDLPMTYVTLVENGVMFAMTLFMLAM